jgi:hypothetical protein
MRNTTLRLLALLAVLGLFAAACGDDAGDEDGADDAVTDDAADDSTGDENDDEDGDSSEAGDAALPEACPASAPFELQAAITEDGGLESFEVVDAAAVSRSGGLALTVYLADFEIDDDTSWSFAVPEVPAGGTLISTGMDVFNADPADLEPLEVGDSGPLFSEAGDGATATFLNMQGEAAPTTSVNQVGTSEILFLDGSTVCIQVDITADSGAQLQGVYTAPIVEDI